MIIKIPIGESSYKIACKEKEKDRLLKIAEILDQKVSNLSMQLGDIDEKTLLVMTALMIQEELEREKEDKNSNIDDDKLDNQDIYDAVSNNIENITDHIKNLTKEIKDY